MSQGELKRRNVLSVRTSIHRTMSKLVLSDIKTMKSVRHLRQTKNNKVSGLSYKVSIKNKGDDMNAFEEFDDDGFHLGITQFFGRINFRNRHFFKAVSPFDGFKKDIGFKLISIQPRLIDIKFLVLKDREPHRSKSIGAVR